MSESLAVQPKRSMRNISTEQVNLLLIALTQRAVQARTQCDSASDKGDNDEEQYCAGKSWAYSDAIRLLRDSISKEVVHVK